MNVVRSWLGVVYFFISSAVLFVIELPIFAATVWFDPNRRILHKYACWWGHHYVQLNRCWTCEFEGVDNIDEKKTYVLVANHQSLFDILVLFGLYKPFKWVSKESIFKVPFVGWNMKLNQYVLIERGDLKSIKGMMRTCRNWLNRGASILMFPEGTRSLDGEIHDFRDGSFRLACDCGVPVVPIVVDGTHDILPKHGKEIKYREDIRVKVLPPVNPADFGNKSAPMRKHVHELMVKTLAEMRQQRSRVLTGSSIK